MGSSNAFRIAAAGLLAVHVSGATVPSGESNATGTSSAPCAAVSAAWAQQIAAQPSVLPSVPAALAYECLNTVPLGKQEAIDLVDAIEPYLEWQTDSAYKADPPADYYYPAYDMFTELARIKSALQADKYANEYEFQSDLYTSVFSPGHDGHYVFYPDALTRVFQYTRARSLVSISEDGTSLPVIKLYEDVISSPETASVVTQINGVDAATYVQKVVDQSSWNQDADGSYNSMFFEVNSPAVGAANGFFSSGGRARYIYHGANTTFSFANGTSATFENKATVKADMTGVVDGSSFYSTFCNPSKYATLAAAAATTDDTASADLPDSVIGYPKPVVITSDTQVSGYYLEDEGVEDVAVLSLLSFEPSSSTEWQASIQKFFADAVIAGKKKLVVDLQGNGGGYILLGYDVFRMLFPNIVQDGFSRWRENPGFIAISKIISDQLEGFDPETSDNAHLIGAWETWFNYRLDLNLTNQPFESFDAKFAPHLYKDTNYTAIMRWNLDDPLTTINSTFGLGIEVSGYGSRANLTQPFAPEDIVLLYDGGCASTCTLFSEMMRIQAGVKSVAMGGRPREGAIQGVGGIKGSQVLNFAEILSFAEYALPSAQNDEQKADLARYSSLPINRSTAGAINTRDQILRDNVNDGLPAQYVVEEADCRLYWTLPMITDISEVWKAAGNAAFNNKACNAGSISYSNVASASAKRADDNLLQWAHVVSTEAAQVLANPSKISPRITPGLKVKAIP